MSKKKTIEETLIVTLQVWSQKFVYPLVGTKNKLN